MAYKKDRVQRDDVLFMGPETMSDSLGIELGEYPTIDEEERGGENDRTQYVQQSQSDLPREIRCDPPEEDDPECLGERILHVQETKQETPVASRFHENQNLDPMFTNQLAGMQFESSLRVGGILRPPTLPDADGSHESDRRTTPSSPQLLQEQRMHLASWDSKYETYACRVDQLQDDRSVEIPLFSMDRPHMRAFHFAWFAFFFAFLAWFAITPLLSEVQRSLHLTKEQLWTSSICSVAGAVVMRCLAGPFCDVYGARWMSAAVLFVCGVPTMLTGLVRTSLGLSALRLAVGIGGSAFVTCQYWTSTMFTREVAGTANALAAGWGNLGGGVAQILVGSVLFPFFRWIYATAGTEKDPADLSWRTCCVLPGIVCIALALVVVRHSDDSPKGN